MRFFIDNNLSIQLARGMAAFGEDVIHLKDQFDPDEDDAVWLAAVGESRRVLITRDERIRYRPNELAAFRDHAVGAFFLGGKNRSRCELIQQLVRNWPRIKEMARQKQPPFAFRIPAKGTKFTELSV